MSRMHSGAKGKSGSSKPFTKTTPEWVSFKPAEVEALVVKLAKEKLTPSMIGIKLRDTYGIPSVKAITGKTIVSILAEKKLTKSLPQDLLDVIGKVVELQKHIETNNQDKSAKRGLQLTESKIKRLSTYYKATGKLAQDWKYNPKQAGVYLE